MTQLQNTTKARKGSHLSYEERVQIQTFRSEGYSGNAIADKLGRARQTIHTEIKDGTVKQVKKVAGKLVYYSIYSAAAGQECYDRARLNSRRPYLFTNNPNLLDYLDNKMLNEKASPFVALQYAKESDELINVQLPCETTLYNWIDQGLMRTKNINLLEKVSRKTKGHNQPRNEKILGNSIEGRPQSVDTREEFGHWEIDTVEGIKGSNEPVLLTLIERKTRYELVIKINSKNAQPVTEALENIRLELGNDFSLLFKTITADNGSEFAGIHEALNEYVAIFFAHPSSPSERGSGENCHRILRRFFPKGKSMTNYGTSYVLRAQNYVNRLPRKLFNGSCAGVLFKNECDSLLKIAVGA